MTSQKPWIQLITIIAPLALDEPSRQVAESAIMALTEQLENARKTNASHLAAMIKLAIKMCDSGSQAEWTELVSDVSAQIAPQVQSPPAASSAEILALKQEVERLNRDMRVCVLTHIELAKINTRTQAMLSNGEAMVKQLQNLHYSPRDYPQHSPSMSPQGESFRRLVDSRPPTPIEIMPAPFREAQLTADDFPPLTPAAPSKLRALVQAPNQLDAPAKTRLNECMKLLTKLNGQYGSAKVFFVWTQITGAAHRGHLDEMINTAKAVENHAQYEALLEKIKYL